MAAGFLLAGAGRAQAQLVYNNGPIDGTYNSFIFGYGWSISESFSVSSAISLTSAQVGLWDYLGDEASALTWSIGTTPGGNDVSTGTSTPSNTLLFANNDNYDVYQSDFPISGSLAAGTTYYFTLLNGTSEDGFPVAWDSIRNGSSPAYLFENGTLFGSGYPSESLQLYGVADGGLTIAMLGSAMTALAFARRKFHA